ncbi:glycosyltransferase family 2 protein [Woodsholea maritima]|uniref:glycosyltransferase family 2 protein n=1 Tax=Woodsholea maritima TaxID=240237 RepID=UPI0003A689B1|nr:glycosyltransferase family 2 protein [Woodsholea maritima]
MKQEKLANSINNLAYQVHALSSKLGVMSRDQCQNNFHLSDESLLDEHSKLQTKYAELFQEYTQLKCSVSFIIGCELVRVIKKPYLIALLPGKVLEKIRRRKKLLKSIQSRSDPLQGLNDFKSDDRLSPTRDVIKQAADLIDDNKLLEATNLLRKVEGKRYNIKLNLLLLKHRSEDEAFWEHSVNKYLSQFSLSPVKLSNEGQTVFDRLSCNPGYTITNGCLISIILSAYNSENTIVSSVQSILNQTWQNIELILINDASTDQTLNLVRSLSFKDTRIKIIDNPSNLGPYVSKNKALEHATGKFITCHDADDWAHPQRLENQVKSLLSERNMVSISYMLRLSQSGVPTQFMRKSEASPDGVMRLAYVSAMFNRAVFDEIGYWDCVRFAADSEMIARAKLFYGDKFVFESSLGMLCLDNEGSLTNHKVYGIDKTRGISPIRKSYKESWMAWHEQCRQENESLYLPFPHLDRKFIAPKKMLTDYNGS